MPDEIFNLVSKVLIVLVLEKTFDNPDVEFEYKGPKITKIADTEKVEGKFYSLLHYSSFMNMRLKPNNQKEETDYDPQLRVSMIKAALENTFGSDNIGYI